jgi:hypothetical protein
MGEAQIGDQFAEAALVFMLRAGRRLSKRVGQVRAGKLAVGVVVRGAADVLQDIGVAPLSPKGLPALFAQ